MGKYDINLLRIVDVPAEIRTGHLLNSKAYPREPTFTVGKANKEFWEELIAYFP
jgi:hypothetical protein